MNTRTCIILIMTVLGTGAVTGGIARERAGALVDYQRLTPMPPAAKIRGYLFGLPVRESCVTRPAPYSITYKSPLTLLVMSYG